MYIMAGHMKKTSRVLASTAHLFVFVILVFSLPPNLCQDASKLNCGLPSKRIDLKSSTLLHIKAQLTYWLTNVCGLELKMCCIESPIKRNFNLLSYYQYKIYDIP